MDPLNEVLSGGVGDILGRFQNGGQDPTAVTDAEAHSSYGQVATKLQPDQYRQAAEAAFNQLTPDQRSQFLTELQAAAQQQGVALPSGLPAGAPTAGQAAQAVTDLHAQQPNLLQQLLSSGGNFSSPLAKLAMLGITVFAAEHLTRSHR